MLFHLLLQCFCLYPCRYGFWHLHGHNFKYCIKRMFALIFPPTQKWHKEPTTLLTLPQLFQKSNLLLNALNYHILCFKKLVAALTPAVGCCALRMSTNKVPISHRSYWERKTKTPTLMSRI